MHNKPDVTVSMSSASRISGWDLERLEFALCVLCVRERELSECVCVCVCVNVCVCVCACTCVCATVRARARKLNKVLLRMSAAICSCFVFAYSPGSCVLLEGIAVARAMY